MIKSFYKLFPTNLGRIAGYFVSTTATTFLFISVIVLFTSFWHERTTGHIPIRAAASLSLFVFLCFLYGKASILALSRHTKNKGGMAFEFLCGYFVLNTLLFFLTLALPLGILTNLLILLLGAIVIVLYASKNNLSINDNQDFIPSLLCIIVSGSAATLWCNDSQVTMIIEGQSVIFRTWQDTFIHVREISSFAQSHGMDTIYNIGIAGIQASIYHYASYISAAAVYALTGATAIEVYSSFQLPFGIFLTGLAAFSLIASIWGCWPALAATVAIVVLPDAYQQGFGNRYLSYNFLTQVNLGMLYGIACVSIAWIFILDGCARGKYIMVLAGYIVSFISLFYKAHIFVANSFLILIYPCFFFHKLKLRWRMVSGIAFVGLFISVINLSQTIDRIPVLRLDGSGIYYYLGALVNDYDPSLLKTFFKGVFYEQQHSKLVTAIFAVAMILLSSFGLWIVATPIVTTLLWHRVAPAIFWFPVFIVSNYLVMSIGLAIDTHHIGTVDELLNRPMVWAYFAIVTWTAGGAYYLALGNFPPQSRMARTGLIVAILISLVGPLVFSQNLQTFPARLGFSNYEEFNAVPQCLVKASQYIRDQSHPGDIIQDAENDPKFIVTALAERQIFAANISFAGKSPAHQERLDTLLGFKSLTDINEVRSYALKNHISWYLLQPVSQVSWPSSILEQATFVCDSYRLFHFEN